MLAFCRVRRETAQRRIGATRPTSMVDARYPIPSASRRSTCGLLQVGGEEPPALGQPLEVVLPTIGKPDLRTRNEVGNGSRHQHLIGPGGRGHPCRDMHGDAADIVSAKLDLSRMHPCSDLEAQAPNGLFDGERT